MREWIMARPDEATSDMHHDAYCKGELIRCKDCKYWKKSELIGGDMICDYTYFNKYYRNADDFCSKAERKEE